MKRLDFTNKRLRKKNEAREYINNVDDQVFSRQMKALLHEPQFSDFYHPSEPQKNGELLFVTVGTGIATYTLDKYLK